MDASLQWEGHHGRGLLAFCDKKVSGPLLARRAI
jgi:hypothetical protein